MQPHLTSIILDLYVLVAVMYRQFILSFPIFCGYGGGVKLELLAQLGHQARIGLLNV